jgi:hypothetical protein
MPMKDYIESPQMTTVLWNLYFPSIMLNSEPKLSEFGILYSSDPKHADSFKHTLEIGSDGQIAFMAPDVLENVPKDWIEKFPGMMTGLSPSPSSAW